MDPENHEPFDREPWRRLLRADSGRPPRDVDRHILAEARRAVAPHGARWWLPASLAASLLLAVWIARWQFEDSNVPPLVTESDVLPAPEAVPLPDEPRHQSPAASPTPEPEGARQELAAPDAAADAAAPAPARALTTREAARFGALKESSAVPRTPEEWYAEIEALRAAGRIEEADAELARLEAAWPGWLARRGKHPE